MRILRAHSRVAALVCAMALLLQVSPSGAAGADVNNPVDFTFTKWGIVTTPAGGMAGFVNGDPAVLFVGHLFTSGASFNNHLRRIEAMYEVLDGDRTFTAMMRGAQNFGGFAILDGVILDGWRIGAPVHVEFQARTPADGGCVGAPPTVTLCWEGTIHVGRPPTRNN